MERMRETLSARDFNSWLRGEILSLNEQRQKLMERAVTKSDYPRVDAATKLRLRDMSSAVHSERINHGRSST